MIWEKCIWYCDRLVLEHSPAGKEKAGIPGFQLGFTRGVAVLSSRFMSAWLQSVKRLSFLEAGARWDARLWVLAVSGPVIERASLRQTELERSWRASQ